MSTPEPSPYFATRPGAERRLVPVGEWEAIRADWLRCYPVGGVTANIWLRQRSIDWRVAWFGHIQGGARGTATTVEEAKELCLDAAETLLAEALDELEARRIGRVQAACEEAAK